ncbi:reverse transcriptase domain-containing protein [Tanacetum coccineum]
MVVTHVTLTAATLVVQQQSSSMSDLVSKFISPTTDEGIDSILTTHTKLTTLVNVPISVATETPATTTTIPPPLFLVTQSSQQTPVTTTTTTNPSTTPLPIPNFAYVFAFNQRVTALESDLSKLKQLNPFAEAISSIPGIVNEYFGSKMKEAVDKLIKDQVKTQTSKIKSKVKKYVTESLGAEVLIRSINQPQTSYKIASSLSELELKKILMDKMEENKSIDKSDVQKNIYNALVKAYNTDKDLLSSYGDVALDLNFTDLNETTHLEFITGDDDVIPARETISNLPPQHWITDLAQAAGTQSSFDEFMATPIDFSAFMINRLKIDHLTQELLIGHTYDLIKGTSYPHNLSKPLPLIPNTRGRLVIPFDHFINNDLEYLKGRSSSRKYTTSITKTKAADYGQVKWIEDRIPRTTWSVVPIDYDKHAYWGTYHWGPKRQRFYGYATNMETSKDVYSRHRIIAVISLKIMKFFGYSHLEEITVRRQDDVLYKFREGDFKRLRRQDIEDMLLLLVQGKLTNLSLDDRYALNVALRMYTRRIVIQERVEDLQLAVESYQKKINLTRPDTTRPDLRKMTPYTGYPDVQGIIYQDELSRNRLMRTDELHKFSDGTLNHVRTTLNDIATGIQMDYLPKRRWSPQDKRRARVMISAIDRKLRDRRLMRSLEKFVGGRPKLKDGGEVNEFQRSFTHLDIERLSRSDKVLKLKNFKKDVTLKLFKSKNQERFIDPEFPDHVYRLKKALYGLKQAPGNVHQSPHGIFISQSQYAIELLKKHSQIMNVFPDSTQMATERLDDDVYKKADLHDQTNYCRMIGGLMYLTASRPDIAFATFVVLIPSMTYGSNISNEVK